MKAMNDMLNENEYIHTVTLKTQAHATYLG